MVATIYPLAFVAEQVGGDFVSVVQITPGGVEPHDYEPSPQQLAQVHSADVFLMNGAGVDAWADKVRDDVAQNGVKTLQMIDGIAVLEGVDEHEGTDEHENLDHADDSLESEVHLDPHVWLSPVNMKKEAERMRDLFLQIDPSHADAYVKNADVIIAKLTALDEKYRVGLAQCALRTAVVSHNAFRYMAERYNFTTLAIAGLSPDEEPSSKRIADLADFAKGENIQYIFFETLVSPKLAETLANEIGATPLVLNPIEGLTSDEKANGATYFTLMADNLTNLRTALQCP